MFFRSRDAQTRFYEEHVEYVHRTARGMTRDEEQALEVTQRVFTEVLGAWGRVVAVRDPRAWLRQMTRNQCCRLWRERARQPVPRELDPEVQRGQWGGAPAVPDEGVAQRQMRASFLRAFHERLDDDERQAIQARYLAPEVDPACDDEDTLEGLAASLGVAKITLRRRLERARRKLHEALAVDGFEFERPAEGDKT